MSQSIPTEIRCTKCDIFKPLDAFGNDRNRRFGKTLYCKVCTAEIQKISRKRNNTQRTEYNRAYRAKNRAAYNEWERNYYSRNKTSMSCNQERWRETIGGLATTLHLSARQRAAKKAVPYELSPDFIRTMILAQNEKCSMTGIPFCYERSAKYKKRPWVPSIDRIDPSRGYTFDNVQIVCHAVNLARNVLDIGDFDRMCRARVEMLDAE